MRHSRASAILHVAPFLWSGAGRVITQLCEAQASTHRIVLVTTGASAGLCDWRPYRRRLRAAGVEHRAIDVFHRDAAGFWTSVTQLAAVIRETRPEVIHAHAGVPACCAAIAREVTGSAARLVGQMYSWGPGRPAWMDDQDLWGFSRADWVVCSARGYQDTLRSGGVPATRLVYQPWGLRLDELPWSPASGLERAPTIGFVGRIEPRKGQLALVEGLARLRERYPGATLELVGPVADKEYAAAVCEAATRRGVDRAVRLTGQVRNVVSYLSRWSAFVSLSQDEGQGLAVLEAMAVGVPVVARPVAGIADFFAHERVGLAIAGDSARGVAAAVGRILREPGEAQARAKRARRLVERRYDWHDTVSAFARLYARSRR